MTTDTRTPGRKLAVAILVAALLAIPLFATYLLVYDRQSQSDTARAGIAQGWGGPQILAGPVLVIPYQDQATETVTEGGRPVTRARTVWKELTLAPQVADIRTALAPQTRSRSIYEAVLYEAAVTGQARFALPADIARYGVTADRLALDRAELRFGLRDARGLFGRPPSVTVDGAALALQPGKGPAETGGSGFHTFVDAAPLRTGAIAATFRFDFRGNGWLGLVPQAGDTRWWVTSRWPHPSFQGGFLPVSHRIGEGFTATWRIGNLALGRALVATGDPGGTAQVGTPDRFATAVPPGEQEARVSLVSPVDLYAQVNRSVKYGFLFIGFTFTAFLMFDLIAGLRVAAAEYLLVGAGLVLFFVLLLALAEVIGFAAAYILASLAIIALNAAYSAAVLGSWRRGGFVAALLGALYGVLYILLSLEAYALLIGAGLLFAALAAIMYLTRNIDWGGARATS